MCRPPLSGGSLQRTGPRSATPGRPQRRGCPGKPQLGPSIVLGGRAPSSHVHVAYFRFFNFWRPLGKEGRHLVLSWFGHCGKLITTDRSRHFGVGQWSKNRPESTVPRPAACSPRSASALAVSSPPRSHWEFITSSSWSGTTII